MSRIQRGVALAALMLLALALALPGAGERGVTAEEVQPYLQRYPYAVGVRQGRIEALPPYEAAGAPPPRWVSTSQWPVVAYNGESRQWPLFIRGHQTALGSYWGILLGPWLGGGIAGIQRSNILLSLTLVWLTYALTRRTRSLTHRSEGWQLLPPLLVALSFGLLFFGRTGYGFELASRVALMATLVAAATPGPWTALRASGVGLLAALAVLCRATIAIPLAPALWLLLRHQFPLQRGWLRWLPFAVMALVPPLVVTLLAALAPFHAGAGPLAGFPVAALPSRLLSFPGHLWVQMAWLGDAQSILGPLRRGGSLAGPLAVGVALAAAPVAAAAWRWRRGSAGLGEQMLVAGLVANAAGGALLYGDPMQFQLGMALEPLFALAVADQVAALPTVRLRLAAVALALVARGQGLAYGLWLDHHGANPMFSARAQKAAVELLQRLGAKGPDVLTTTYNHVGVLEAWSDGNLRPIHAWETLRPGALRPGDSTLPAMRELLRRYQPRYVLLTDGANLYEGPFAENATLAQALREAVRLEDATLETEWPLPTESGAKGWRIVALTYR